MTKIAGREVSTVDTVLIGTGIVALIDLFLPWYRVSYDGVTIGGVKVGGGSASANAFDANFAAWFGTLLLVAVGALVAAKIFAGFALPTNAKAGPALILLALSAVGLLLIILRFLTETHHTFIGLWLAVVLGIVQVFYLFKAFQASGEKLPDFGNRGSSSPPAPPADPAPPTV